MKTFNDIEALWKTTQQAAVPDADVIIKLASKQKKTLGNKILFQVVSLLAALASLVFVLCFIKFRFASSYIGLALMIVCIVVFTAVRFRQSLFLKKADFSQSPGSLLLQFEQFYQHQKWVNTKGTMIYTVILNIAFVFYFYEILLMAPLSVIWKIGFLVIYATWMLIATLWLNKRYNRKEHKRTADIIEKLKQLQTNLE